MSARARAIGLLAGLGPWILSASGGLPPPGPQPQLARACFLAESLRDAASAAAELVYADFDPLVLSPRFPAPVELRVRTDGSIDSAEVELAAGGTLPLSPSGREFYVATLTPSQALYGYGPDDAQHNFVGFLNLNRAGARILRYNLFINVLDEEVPEVPVEAIASDLQASPHLVNLYLPGILPANLDAREITRRFYREYPDRFEFINIVSTPAYSANRYHFQVRNDVQGTGVSLFDRSADYGSAGRLQGINRFPIPGLFDMAEKATLHEIGHQWINYLTVPALRGGIPHWPISSLARGIMGWSLQGGQGGDFPYDFVPLGNGEYRMVGDNARLPEFNDMELYLMGFLPAEAVGLHFAFPDQSQPFCSGCVWRGAVPVSVEDLIRAHGPRVPPFPNAQTEFAVATIIVSTLRPLSRAEMAFFDHFAARGEATTPQRFSSGFAKGTALPFSLATGGRGSLSTTLGPRLR